MGAIPHVTAQTISDATPYADLKNTPPREKIVPDLTGVSETMLWSLHNRATEAQRADGVIVDPESIRIQAAINYDFERRFGGPLGSLAARAAEIDRVLLAWLERHPDGTVVSLGEGLETQGRRVDNGRMRWLTVDLPDAIRLRECFLPPTERFRHIALSALDPAWMNEVDPSAGVFIVAQGLLMYLPPERVENLFAGIADRFPGADFVFDVIPRWFSQLTLLGLNQTASYRLPSMPWGIDRNEVEPTLRRWHPNVAEVAFLPYQSPRRLARLFAEMASRMPVARHQVPSLVHVTIASATAKSPLPLRAPDQSVARATMEIATFSTPFALADAQARLARSWFARATWHWIAMGIPVPVPRRVGFSPPASASRPLG